MRTQAASQDCSASLFSLILRHENERFLSFNIQFQVHQNKYKLSFAFILLWVLKCSSKEQGQVMQGYLQAAMMK